MNLVQVRDAIVGQLEATVASMGIPVFYENAVEIDLTNTGDYFLECEINFDGAAQASIEETPIQRNYGTLVLSLSGRQTKGTRQMLGYMDTLSAAFRFKTLGGVQMQAAPVYLAPGVVGWHTLEMRIPFFADTQ